MLGAREHRKEVFNLKAVLLLVALVKGPDNKVLKKRTDFFFRFLLQRF